MHAHIHAHMHSHIYVYAHTGITVKEKTFAKTKPLLRWQNKPSKQPEEKLWKPRDKEVV